MSRNLFIIGGLALLLLLGFGCAGNGGTSQSGSYSPPPTMGSGSTSGSNSGSSLGDSDIAPATEPNENALSTQDVVPPDNSTLTVTTNSSISNTTTSGNMTAGTLPSESDLALTNDSSENLISQQDVVEPG